MVPTMEGGSILRVDDAQMLMQDDPTYTRYYFFTDMPRSSVDGYVGAFESGYQELRRVRIARAGSLGAFIAGDSNPLLRVELFLRQNPYLVETGVLDCSTNAVFMGDFLDESEPDIYLPGMNVVFSMF